MVVADFAKILLSLDAFAVDSMLLQKLAQALRFDILISFFYRLSFVWNKFQEDSLLLYLALRSTELRPTMGVCALP